MTGMKEIVARLRELTWPEYVECVPLYLAARGWDAIPDMHSYFPSGYGEAIKHWIFARIFLHCDEPAQAKVVA